MFFVFLITVVALPNIQIVKFKILLVYAYHRIVFLFLNENNIFRFPVYATLFDSLNITLCLCNQNFNLINY